MTICSVILSFCGNSVQPCLVYFFRWSEAQVGVRGSRLEGGVGSRRLEGGVSG